MSKVTAYPLSWPLGYSRTPAFDRQRTKFFRTVNKRPERLTIAEAVSRVMDEFHSLAKCGKKLRVDPDYVVISTNLRTRIDGLPASGQRDPEDPGVAVYFEQDGQSRVMCCDRWNTVAGNLAAVAATLGAMRSLDRWGVSDSQRAFTGFSALPEPGKAHARTCWQILGVEPTRSRNIIAAAYREMAQSLHPDRPGGSHDAMAELNAARDQALKNCP